MKRLNNRDKEDLKYLKARLAEVKRTQRLAQQSLYKSETEEERKARKAKIEISRRQLLQSMYNCETEEELEAMLAKIEISRRRAQQSLYNSEKNEKRQARKARSAQERRQSLKSGLVNVWHFIVIIIIIMIIGFIWNTISVALFGDCGTREQCQMLEDTYEYPRP